MLSLIPGAAVVSESIVHPLGGLDAAGAIDLVILAQND